MLKSLVYICMPYSHDPIASQIEARNLCEAIVHKSPDKLPIAPQIYLHQFMDESTSREVIMEQCLKLLDMCDEVMVWGTFLSEGMKEEIAHVRNGKKDKMITYTTASVDALKWDLDNHFDGDEP